MQAGLGFHDLRPSCRLLGIGAEQRAHVVSYHFTNHRVALFHRHLANRSESQTCQRRSPYSVALEGAILAWTRICRRAPDTCKTYLSHDNGDDDDDGDDGDDNEEGVSRNEGPLLEVPE